MNPTFIQSPAVIPANCRCLSRHVFVTNSGYAAVLMAKYAYYAVLGKGNDGFTDIFR
jgi:hypothetical protein